MHAGTLSIKVHKAHLEEELGQGDGCDELHCTIKISDYGKLSTTTGVPSSSTKKEVDFRSEELSFHVGPMIDSDHGIAQVMIYRSDGDMIGCGSLNLVDLREDCVDKNVVVSLLKK